jgi:outer membrane protein TolC
VKRQGTDVSRVQVSQTNAQLETRRALLIRAKARVKDLSAQLKRDMNDPDFPVSGATIILPASPALEEAVHFDQKDVVDTALANRLELGQQLLRVKSADTALAVGKNNLLPQLNAAGSIDFQGLSGDLGNAIGDQLEGKYVSWSLGLELEIPIGNRAARATYQRALMQRAQAVESYQAAIATVTFECDTAVRDVYTSWDALAADRRSVFAAGDALRGLEQREAAGGELSPEFVQLKLQYQDQLAETRRAEAASLANYNQAIAVLEQRKGTLLQYNNILMQEDMIPYERKLLSMSKR